MCGPIAIPIAMGVATAGLGIGQQIASYQQAKTNTAYRNAAAQQQYEYGLLQAQSSREYESQRSLMQDDIISQNAEIAAIAHAGEISGANLRYMQEQEAAAQKRRESSVKLLESRGEVVAAGRVGNVVDTLLADLYRRDAAFDYANSRNLAFSMMQTQEAKRGAQAQYASRLASQQPYLKRTILDPIKPLKEANPSSLPYVLGGAGSVLSGVTAGLGTASSMQGLAGDTPIKLWG